MHLGGNNKQYNLVSSCVPCNNKRGGAHWEDMTIEPLVLERLRASTLRPLTADERAEGRKLWRGRTTGKKSIHALRPHWTEEIVSPREPGEDDDVEPSGMDETVPF